MLRAFHNTARLIQRSRSTETPTVLVFGGLPDDVSVSSRLDRDEATDQNYELLQIEDSKGPKVQTQGQLPTAIDEGKIYYRTPGGTAKMVTKDLINKLWDAKYGTLMERTSDLDWSRNCADYATGPIAAAVHKGDIKATKKYLSENYDLVGSLDLPDKDKFTVLLRDLEVGEYVATGASHFVKLEVNTKGSRITVTEKDGESGIYRASGAPEVAASVLCLSFQFSCEFYKKRT
ncbi:hypothetical protein SBA3_2250017 [Candidatus Sulfopaludibacter sp. SbA3]|nr:hypothetical protein SBA3_2250017 [Candidatus Sulfopaludibacter sp. SbA3]